ncbi:Uncharacterised protein [Zhongshania aliphaticivorans]|nr:Uncharacterised protein [Zhongshania aliphaticivorans]
MAGNLGRHYYKKAIVALTFASINLRLGNFAELMSRNTGTFIEHRGDIRRAKLV